MQKFQNKIILQILDKYKDLWALSYTSAVANWDLETYMPPLGASARGEALGRLSTIRQKLFLDPAFAKLVATAGTVKNLTDEERGVVRVLTHSLKFYEKLPPKFLEDFSVLTSKATLIWREAKNTNNFKLFEPSLTKIFAMNKQMAEYLGYDKSPYDALLDQFEEGLTVDQVEPFFNEIRVPLQQLINKIGNSKKYFDVHPLEKAKYDKDKMRVLNEKVLKFLWSEFGQNFRLDESTHPFTTSFSKYDTRITTRYHDTDFARSLLAVVHEFGHALYDLQCANELEMTPIQGGSSLVIHESQSRFWENFVGRSELFIKHFQKDIEGLSPEISNILKRDVQGTTLYMYLNKVGPGLIRTEADEVTYHFHIMLRYEIEKEMIEGKIKTKDLPEIWNEKMKEYLGVSPRNDSDGVLQDVHWSGGMVGYFPTYSLGTFLSAQWDGKISQNSKIKSNNYNLNLKTKEKWLGEHIHQYGSTYTLQDLLSKNKMKYDPKVNLKYLQDKYSKLY